MIFIGNKNIFSVIATIIIGEIDVQKEISGSLDINSQLFFFDFWSSWFLLDNFCVY